MVERAAVNVGRKRQQIVRLELAFDHASLKYHEHHAAVKAIAWSPHQHGLLASGGGTADRCIRFWNTVNNTALSCIDTGSQVCNLMWSKNVNEIVSIHGYSLNQIILWKYPSMVKVAELTGHTSRVLHMAQSPDGTTIVSAAADETLRFWRVFGEAKTKSGKAAVIATLAAFFVGNGLMTLVGAFGDANRQRSAAGN